MIDIYDSRLIKLFIFPGVSNAIDLVFALDTSSDVNITALNYMKSLVTASLKSYQITQQLAHIGLVSYGRVGRTMLPLSSGVDRTRIRSMIARLPEIGGQRQLSNVAKHLESTTFNTINGARRSVPKAVVLFVAGKNDIFDEPQFPIYATLLNRAGVEVILINIGDGDRKSALKRIPERRMNYITAKVMSSLPEIYGALERRLAVIAGTFSFAGNSFPLTKLREDHILRLCSH